MDETTTPMPLHLLETPTPLPEDPTEIAILSDIDESFDFAPHWTPGANQAPLHWVIETTEASYEYQFIKGGPLVANDQFVIDWGDGTPSQSHTQNGDASGNLLLSHTYATAGTYEIKITGKCRAWGGNGGAHSNSHGKCLLRVQSWGDVGLESLKYAFARTNIYQPKKPISSITIPNNIPSTVTNLEYAFYSSGVNIKDVGMWNVENVTNMLGTFSGNLSMRSAEAEQPDLSNWNTGKVTDMGSMFSSSDHFNGDISEWNTSNVTDMYKMFYYCEKFNQPIGAWNVGKVTRFGGMFSVCKLFNQELNSWNVTSCLDFTNMFAYCSDFNQPLNNWDMSSVKKLNNMFMSAAKFNQDIGSWNVANVERFNSTFRMAHDFNQNLENWDISFAIEGGGGFGDFLENVTLSVANYDALLVGWSTLDSSSETKIPPNCIFHGGNSKYSSAGESARTKLIDVHAWQITDGGLTDEIPTPTPTPVVVTPTPTPTPVVVTPTPTPTPTPVVVTPTPTQTNTSTPAPQPTPTPTQTPTPIPTSDDTTRTTRISSLASVNELDLQDEFIVVDKSVTIGPDASSTGKTSKTTLLKIKEAVAASGEKGTTGDKGERGSTNAHLQLMRTPGLEIDSGQNKVSKISGDGAWDQVLFSKTHLNTCCLTFSPGHADKTFAMGIASKDDDKNNLSLSGIKLGFQLLNNGNFVIVQSGQEISEMSAYTSDDVFQIIYDSRVINLSVNGMSHKVVNVSSTDNLYRLSSTFYDVGDNITQFISFMPMNPAGPQGQPGPIGNTGVRGDIGPKGSPGNDSTTAGPEGPGGAKGNQGLQGIQGIRGLTGLGLKGEPSAVPGPKGPVGSMGIQGLKGIPSVVPGPKGSVGIAGPQGIQGSSGIQGPKGSVGIAGPQGIQGIQGKASTEKGPRGNDGTTGPQGIQGKASTEKGPRGNDGTTGSQGIQGIQGKASTVPGPAGTDGAPGPQGPAGKESIIPGPQGEPGTPGSSLNWRGDYDKTLSYDKNDIVLLQSSPVLQFNGNVYVCKTSHSTHEWPFQSGKWQLMVNKPKDGDKGTRGAASTVKGPQGDKSTVSGPSGTDGESFNWRGEFSLSSTYQRNDVMVFSTANLSGILAQTAQFADGNVYIATEDIPKGTPPNVLSNSGPWDLFSPRGRTGKQGTFADLTASETLQLMGDKGDRGASVKGPQGDKSIVPGPAGPQGKQGVPGISISYNASKRYLYITT
jgi:surface protein